MLTELDNIREHWTRYRSVTLEHLNLLTEEELMWRPLRELFSCGQQLVHILQTEKFYSRGLFYADWDASRLHFPAVMPTIGQLRVDFETTRAQTVELLDALTSSRLDDIVRVPHAPVDLPLRWWLWFVLEHELHHKAQLSLYLRQLGKVPPYFAMVLPDRPDIRIRAEWGDM
jgi:uncharacterized damage-inducible protein DinB